MNVIDHTGKDVIGNKSRTVALVCDEGSVGIIIVQQ